MIKNYLFTGNPVYPVFTDIIGGRDWAPNSTLLFINTVRNANLLSHSSIENLSIPWHLTFRQPAETTIGPGLLALSPLSLISILVQIRAKMEAQKSIIKTRLKLVKPKRRTIELLSADSSILVIPSFFAMGFLALWISKLAQVARFALPSIVLTVIVLAILIDNLLKKERESGANNIEKQTRVSFRVLQLAISVVLIAGVLINLFLTVVDRANAIKIASSPNLSKEFTSNSGLYQISAYINNRIPKNQKIAMVVDNRAYYLNRNNMLMLNPLNNGRIDQISIETPDRLISILKQERVSHVFITDEVRRYVYALPKNSPYRIYYPLINNCDLLIKQGILEPVHRNGDFWLYEIM